MPEASQYEKDRKISVTSMRNCPLHNRLLMQFSYPSSCKPKETHVIPYIDDNIIHMNNIKDNPDDQIISWLSFVKVKSNERKEQNEAHNEQDGSISL